MLVDPLKPLDELEIITALANYHQIDVKEVRTQLRNAVRGEGPKPDWILLPSDDLVDDPAAYGKSLAQMNEKGEEGQILVFPRRHHLTPAISGDPAKTLAVAKVPPWVSLNDSERERCRTLHWLIGECLRTIEPGYALVGLKFQYQKRNPQEFQLFDRVRGWELARSTGAQIKGKILENNPDINRRDLRKLLLEGLEDFITYHSGSDRVEVKISSTSTDMEYEVGMHGITTVLGKYLTREMARKSGRTRYVHDCKKHHHTSDVKGRDIHPRRLDPLHKKRVKPVRAEEAFPEPVDFHCFTAHDLADFYFELAYKNKRLLRAFPRPSADTVQFYRRAGQRILFEKEPPRDGKELALSDMFRPPYNEEIEILGFQRIGRMNDKKVTE